MKIKKKIFFGIFIVTFIMLVIFNSCAQEKIGVGRTLTVGVWGSQESLVREYVVKPFEAETGATVELILGGSSGRFAAWSYCLGSTVIHHSSFIVHHSSSRVTDLDQQAGPSPGRSRSARWIA